MHPRQIRNFEPMKVVARGEGYSYKSQGRIQGIDGSTFVCTLWGEPKERASESARKNTNECQKGTEEERLRRLGRMRHSSWASGMCDTRTWENAVALMPRRSVLSSIWFPCCGSALSSRNLSFSFWQNRISIHINCIKIDNSKIIP